MITKATLPSDTLLLESTTNTSLDEAAMASTVPGLWKESARKLFHMIGLVVPAVYFFTSRRLAIQILVPLTATSVLLDLVRHRHGKTGDIFTEIFGSILRAHERDREAKNLNGLTWFLIGVTVATTCMAFLLSSASEEKMTVGLPMGMRTGDSHWLWRMIGSW